MVTVTDAEISPVKSSVGRLSKIERRWARGGTLLAVVVFWLLATCFQPWQLFDRGPYTSDFYDVQARSLVQGHFDIPANVAGIEGFVIDGKTQIYFGIGPAIMRLPFSGLSDVFDRRLSLLSELLAVSVLGLAAARLLKRAQSLVADAPMGSPWWFGAFAAVSTLGTPILFFASSPVVYHEAELWGAAAGLAGLDLVLRWWREPTRRHLIEAVTLATFAVACRPSSGLSPAVALGVFGLMLAWRRRWTLALAVLIGSVIPLLAFAIVNWARFGSLFSVPFPLQVFSQFNVDRQAMLRDNNGSFFGIGFAPTNIGRYLSPFAVSFERLFPFVAWPSKATVYGGVTFDTIDHSGSIITGAPTLVPLAFIGAWWTVRRDQTRQWTVIALAALISTVSTLTIAYVAHRYLADLLPPLIVLAAAGIWCAARTLQNRPNWMKRAVSVVLALLFVFGFWNQLGLAVLSRAFSILPTQSNSQAMVELQYSVDEWLFGGAPPDVIRITEGPLPSDVTSGTIAILGDCDAVYRFDGYGWGPIERRVGGNNSFEITGTVGDERRTVLNAQDWELSAQRTAQGVVFIRSGPNVEPRISDPIAIPNGEVTLNLIVDPSPIEVVLVYLNGREIFYSVPGDSQGVTVGDSWRTRTEPAQLCDSLLKRFGS